MGARRLAHLDEDYQVERWGADEEATEEDPPVRAADRYATIRKFAPALLEVLEFKAAKANDPILAAITLLRNLNQSSTREVPPDAPLPFRKEWRRLVTEIGKPNRRLYETAVLATLRNKLRSGDVWVERSSNYCRFDSYLLPAPAVTPIAAELDLPATADEWLETRGRELDRRLKRFAQRLERGQLEGVEMRDERLHVAALKAIAPAEAEALADRLDAMMPRGTTSAMPSCCTTATAARSRCAASRTSCQSKAVDRTTGRHRRTPAFRRGASGRLTAQACKSLGPKSNSHGAPSGRTTSAGASAGIGEMLCSK